MASSGAAAWAKYFQGRGDLATTVKKKSGYYDILGKKKLGDIDPGTAVTYLRALKYEQRALVAWGNKQVRIPFNNLAKPGVRASGAASLKPQAFGVRDNKYNFTVYKNLVANSIEERQDLTAPVKAYLSALFDYYCGGSTTTAELKKIFEKSKIDLPIGDINKDFGEVVGPAACIVKKLLAPKGVILNHSCKIYMPERPNEPLMDYGLYQGNKQFVISAKSGKTTNVVKPGDIIMLLAKDPKKIRKWEKTPEYRLLEMLANNSILVGPIRAVADMYPDLIDPYAAAEVTKKYYNPGGFRAFIRTNEYLSNRLEPTANEIMYECEKMIMNETKSGKLDMNGIFSDAIQEQVLYVKFEVGPDGVGKWGVIASDDIAEVQTYTRIYLRTKNGYTRSADRMGVQL